MALTAAAQARRQVWNRLQAQVRRRDHSRCVTCRSTTALAAHHIVARRHGGIDAMRNLITLCRPCHDLAEEAGWSWIQAHRYHQKSSTKFNDQNPPSVALGPSEHLARSHRDGKWRVWGRDRLGLYAIEVLEGGGSAEPAVDENVRHASPGAAEAPFRSGFATWGPLARLGGVWWC